MLPLLRTKTTIPPIRPRQIERPRLLEQVNEGMRRALTLVIAPAGFGKTTLAAAWAGNAGLPVAWLSLQPADRPRERFLSYLVQALQTIHARLGQTSLALMQGGSPEGALFALVNDLAGLESDFVLVLDDYHSIDSPESGEILGFLLEHRPAAFHLILTTRSVPSLNLARLRALDQVTEISAADLRFTETEVRAFIETGMDLRLPAEALVSLNQSTEGWAVGLQLAALALARQPEKWQALAGQEHIFDYLAEEVLRRELPEVQELLKITALFDRFCVPQLDYILQTTSHALRITNNELPITNNLLPITPLTPESAAHILSHIERANLFLVPLDSAWYRYHALFTDFLRKLVSPEQAIPLYRAASDWCEQNDLLDDAIHYTVHAADYERAARLLENHYRDMLQRGEQAAIGEWIAALPPELLQTHPRLWLAQGWANLIALNSTRAQECAARAEALLPADGAGDKLRGESKALRILGSVFAGQPPAADEISEAFVLLSEQDDFLHSLLHFNLGLHHVMQGQTAQAVEAFTETLRLTSAFSLPLVTIVAHVQLGETRQLRGALGLAERTFQQVIRYAKETLGERTFLLGMPYISYAELLREQNRFDEAARYAEQGIAYCHTWQPIASMDGHITLARLLAAQNRWDEAFAHLESAMQEAETSASVLDDAFIAIQMARLSLLRGDSARAAQIINAYEMEKTSDSSYYHFWEMIQLVLYRAKVNGLASAPETASPLIEALSTLIAKSERCERVTPVIEALVLRSYALHAAGKHPEAAESLTRALTLGAQGGYARIFADEGRQLLHLLEQYRPQLHAPHTYLDQILAILRRENIPAPVTPSTFNFQPGLPLTRRELDILTLLAAGKSNQEIAAERVLTINTVKKHVANILSKLGVANRTQAVVLARKQGWIA
jgi:LuxR family maltose regulon positive regulatory protein